MKKHEVFPIENVVAYFIALRYLKIIAKHPMEMIDVFPADIAIKSFKKIDINFFMKDIA